MANLLSGKSIYMNIKEVIDHSIMAVFSDTKLSDTLVLKGGSAIRLFEKIDTRLSIDADFSIENKITNETTFFNRINKALVKHFKPLNYEVFQYRYFKRPKTRKQNYPEWWTGWKCEFKLVSFKFKDLPNEAKERRAFKPEGTKSPIIRLEISEHEYCSLTRSRTIKGIKIQGYTKVLIVLEKIRALCQQHKSYKFQMEKNRARDFYDIYKLTQKIPIHFMKECRKNIDKVFKAKEVPLDILNVFWKDNDFLDSQREGFKQLEATVSGPLYPFKTYLEHLKSLIQEIVHFYKKAKLLKAFGDALRDSETMDEII